MRSKLDVLLIISFTVIILSAILASQTSLNKITGYSSGNAEVCVGNTPSLASIGNLNATVGTAFSYDANHTVAGGDPVTYADTASFFDISQASGEISFTPQESDTGNHTIVISVNNTACAELGDVEELNFEILTGNRAPVLDTIENQTVWEDDLLSMTLHATDPDGDNIIYACNDTTHFTANETTGLIEWTPTNEDVGTHWFECNATDDYGASDSGTFYVWVRNTNDVPILDIIDNFTVENNTPAYEDQLFQYDVNATDPDGDTIEYLDNTTLFNIDSETGEISFIPLRSQVGNHSVEIYATDNIGPGIAQQLVLVEILEVNDAPVLGPIGAQTAKINSSYTFDVNATDEEDGGESMLTFSDDTGLFDINPATGMISFTPTDSDLGNYTINITVTDNGIPALGLGNATDSEVISFSVTEANMPPNITSYTPETPVSMQTGESQGFTITAEDPDGGTPSAKWYLDNSEINGSTAYTYTFTPSTAGTYNLTIVITDGELDDSQEWAVTVTTPPTPPGPAAPGGGGAFGGKYFCKEIWVCTDWSTCSINDIQIRTCKDLKECWTEVNKPSEVKPCIYTPIPSCFDSIKNQNEILPDCGGVCNPCPTCNDGICNQGELCEICDEDPRRCPRDIEENVIVDCGGPCPLCPKVERVVQPKTTNWKALAISITKITILTLFALLIGLIIALKVMRHLSKEAVLTEIEKSELDLIKQINSLVEYAENAIDTKDMEQLKLICANIEGLYNSLSSTKNKKKIYPKIKRLKRAIRAGF